MTAAYSGATGAVLPDTNDMFTPSFVEGVNLAQGDKTSGHQSRLGCGP